VGIVAVGAEGEIAYYYPEPYWLMEEGGWIKSLLLCFDKIAVLLPEYMRGRETEADPALAGPLVESGHLVLVHPETFVDTDLTERLTEAMVELITAGAFDDIESQGGFAELSMSRMGFYGDRGLFDMVLDELKGRGLARATADGLSIPLHPLVRRAYLLLLAQFARHAGARQGLDLHPTSNLRGVGSSLAHLLQAEGTLSKGHVVEFDLNTIGYDLDPVPLDEVLDYRRQHQEEHKRYMRNLRQFVGELSTTDPEERPSLYEARAAELREDAQNLAHRVRRAWRAPATAAGFSVGIAGAGWSMAGGDQVGTLLGLAGLGVGLFSLLSGKDQGSAYSYLFSVRSDLPYVMST
jgi:hypothetical protein